MPGEETVLTVAGQAIEQGLDKLPPKTKTIVTNSILGVAGIILCIMSFSHLAKVLFPKKQQQPV